MKVCLLCFNLSESSGSGMDVYAYNIVSHLKQKMQFSIVQESFRSTPEWLIKEFLVPRYWLQTLKVDADIYHAVSPVGAKAAVLARKSPIVTTVHDLIPISLPETKDYYKLHAKKRRWLNPWYWWFLKKSDHFIATSESTKRDSIRILKINPEKISVVHYGVDHQKFQSTVRKSYHCPKNILYIGALEPGKGIYTLIQAFYLVAKNLKDVNLLIGGRGKALPILIKMVNNLGIRDKVKFPGFIPDEKLSYYYELSDVFVFPSYYGVHLMFLDAMASGLPVIAGNALDAEEYLGDAGLLIKPGDVHQFAEAIVSILTDQSRYTELSRKAVDRAKNFSWEKMAKETMVVYKKLI